MEIIKGGASPAGSKGAREVNAVIKEPCVVIREERSKAAGDDKGRNNKLIKDVEMDCNAEEVMWATHMNKQVGS